MISASAWLLDLTRLVSRVGRGPLTGIDRVELAYLRHLLAGPEPLFGLVRTAVGFVLLDKAGANGVLDRVLGTVTLGPADLLSLLTQRHLPQALRAEADARRLAVARCVPMRLGATLCRVLPRGAVYVNVGHANLSARVMRAVKSVADAAIVVLVHDTIPLDYPQYCRPGMASAFAKKLAVVESYADYVVHTAQCTRRQTEAHFTRIPPGIVAPLGVESAINTAPSPGNSDHPYFVALGTIEPRKNVGLLVKVWQELQRASGPVPHLYIVGNRGWAEPALFDDLATLVAGGHATLQHTLGDGAVSALLRGARALLFPSFAEGYGLPPLEAAALGVPVIAGKLPVVVEMLDDYPVYLDTSDVYAWVNAITQHMKHQMPQHDADRQIRVPPNWADHFQQVFAWPDGNPAVGHSIPRTYGL